METDRDELFRTIEPPSGGVHRMRAKLAREGMPVSRVQWSLAAAGIVMLAVVIFVVGTERPDVPVPAIPTDSVAAAPQFDRLLGRELTRIDLAVQRNDQAVALTQIASSNAKVRIYALN